MDVAGTRGGACLPRKELNKSFNHIRQHRLIRIAVLVNAECVLIMFSAGLDMADMAWEGDAFSFAHCI